MWKWRREAEGSSSGEVDLWNLCTTSVRSTEDLVKGRQLINERQCKDLSIKLSKAALNIRELVDKCGGSASLFRRALEELYRCMEKGRVLVSNCGEDDWCAAAVFQIHNENAFQEILMEVGLCYNAIYEQARSMSEDSNVDVEDLRVVKVFQPATEDEILGDQHDLQTRLEELAKEPKSVKWLHRLEADKATVKQCLAEYLVKKVKFTSQQSQASSLEACSEILWQKESEVAGTWGKSAHFLGAGAMGGVLKTKWMGIPCAKKVVRVKEYESLFLKEAGIMAHLKHPCVIDFFCCGNGEETGGCFIAMEVMEKSLGKLIEDQKGVHFPLGVVIDMMVQIARGMRYLHDRGIAHRDMKPGNVVVSRFPSRHLGGYFRVKLVDFGVSKTEVEVSKSNTMTAPGIGTTRYKAPEVFREGHPDGKGKATWFKADVFSFAMTCAHLLSLKTPFAEMGNMSASELYKKLRSGERPALPSDCPEELVALLKECWKTKPKLRPSFMGVCSRLEKLRHKLLRGWEGGDGGLEEKNIDWSVGLKFLERKVEEQSLVQTPLVHGSDEDEEVLDLDAHYGTCEKEVKGLDSKLPGILSCVRGHGLESLPQPPARYGKRICNICWKDGNEEFFCCETCDFDAHMDCVEVEVEVNVFFHNHPLHLLIRNYYNNNEEATCRFCGEVVQDSEWVYRCERCDFDVHALCTKYPEERNVHGHAHHLTLVQSPPNRNLSCDWCHGEVRQNTWRYTCIEGRCSMDVHPSCTSLSLNPLCIFESGHRLFFRRNRGFYCGKCGCLGFSWHYHCKVCDVDIHLDCINDMEEEEDNWNEFYEESMAQCMAENAINKMDVVTQLLDKLSVGKSSEGCSSSISKLSSVLVGLTMKEQRAIHRPTLSEIARLHAIIGDGDLRKKIGAETTLRKAKRMRGKIGRLESKVKELKMLESKIIDLESSIRVLQGDVDVLALILEKLKSQKYIVEEEIAMLAQSRMRYAPCTFLFFLEKDEDKYVRKVLAYLQADMKNVRMGFLCEEPGHQHLVEDSSFWVFGGARPVFIRILLQPLLASGLEVVAKAMSKLVGSLSQLDCVTLPCLGKDLKWDLRAIELEKHGKLSEFEESIRIKGVKEYVAKWILSNLERDRMDIYNTFGLLRVRYIVTEDRECSRYARGLVAWLCKEHLNRGLEAGILESYPMKYYNYKLN